MRLTVLSGVETGGSIGGRMRMRLGLRVDVGSQISKEWWTRISDDGEASSVMPELCIEVLSEGNTEDEMQEKRVLYFKEGAQEGWTCDVEGVLHFYDENGARTASALAPPHFPTRLRRATVPVFGQYGGSAGPV